MLMATDALAPFSTDSRRSLAGRTILQIVPRIDAGGAERTTIDIAAALVRAGARAIVASQGGRLAAELQSVGGIAAPFPAATKNPFSMLLNTRRLARLIVSEKVDIVHARSRAPAWVALGACRMTGRPLVTTYHGAYGGRSGLKLRYNSVMARGDAVIANSQFTANIIARLYPEARRRVRVIYRGADFAKFSPEAVNPSRVSILREQWGVAAHEQIVLLAARLTGWKGHKVLVEAASILARQGLTGVRFILAGDPQGRNQYVRELDALIEKAGLKNIVSRVGHCADMPAALLTASIVVVPSIQPEAFGRSAVEAQAMGALVVVSDLGAVAETVLAPPQTGADRRTGWRVPAGDAAALAQAIAAAFDLGASERAAIAQRARQHVLAAFSLDKMTSQTLDLYLETLPA